MESQPEYPFPNFVSGAREVQFDYSASCCDPQVIIIATDVDGNLGTCFIDNGDLDTSQGE